jgi:hypothetical protein
MNNKMILKAGGLNLAVSGYDVERLLNIKQICDVLEVSYNSVRQRMHQKNESAMKAIEYFVNKGE